MTLELHRTPSANDSSPDAASPHAGKGSPTHGSPADQHTLESRYTGSSGHVQLTGIQALTRLPIDQHRRDRAQGLRVGTFITGYEGSPLAGYDLELAKRGELLDANDIHFSPGLNEEAAATAIQGTQLVQTLEGSTRDGVLGIWYGKAPGLDRAADALRHGNMMGAHPRGGAVVLVGDDPAAKSSSVPCASELALADLGMPVLYPADSQDVIELGLHAVELSRSSGLWVGLKVVTAVADGSSTVDLHAITELPQPVVPHGAKRHEPTGRLLQPTLGPLERDLVTTRRRLAVEYAAANELNQIMHADASDTLGIIAAGRTFHELRSALTRHGLSEDTLKDSPVRLLKVGMPWPLDPGIIAEFSDGLEEILVVEEKRSFMESAVRDVLYGSPAAPHVTGKQDPDGRDLIPGYGELDADTLFRLVGKRLRAFSLGSEDGDRTPQDRNGRTLLPMVPAASRTPFFCSGCPHNSSTKPSGDTELVGAGIGCHTMVLLMDEDQVGTVTGLTQMGGEGLQWLGMAPFIDKDHFVQNIGDGTFDHSGSLAIRAAVAGGAHITYRLLYNSAVAMTGGQQATSGMSLEQIVAVLKAEGVSRIIITTEDLSRRRSTKLPRDVKVWHRDRMDEAHRELAATDGVTVLIHDQECATELRRKRKRGSVEAPPLRVAINERICEGCGDCGVKSTCLSVQPVETDLGRKTRIHQSSCNIDLSCLSGDCPAFMTISGAAPAGAAHSALPEIHAEDIPEPTVRRPGQDFGVRLAGVGGTGVVTVSHILATAGLLAGWYSRSLDQTGLAQKGGAVVSDVRFHRESAASSNKLSAGECDAYLGLDLLVAADQATLGAVSADRTVVVLNTAEVPTGRMVADPTVSFPDASEITEAITLRAAEAAAVCDARTLTTVLFGTDQYANIFMVGAAFQAGAIGLPAEAIEEAITLNGAAVQDNIQAFRRGRQMVADPGALQALAESTHHRTEQPDPWAALDGETEVDRLLRTRSADLVEYQDQAYADHYRLWVEAVQRAESATVPGATALTEAAAQYLYKLMAYKDEYEVARLALDAGTAEYVREEFGEQATASWNLHPPTLRAMGMTRKLRLGPWFTPGMAALRRMKTLRGTRWDIFGMTSLRGTERALITEYTDLLQMLCDGLTPQRHQLAVEIASLPDVIRGYEGVKERNIASYRERLAELLDRWSAHTPGA